jgi:hypothetical protein
MHPVTGRLHRLDDAVGALLKDVRAQKPHCRLSWVDERLLHGCSLLPLSLICALIWTSSQVIRSLDHSHAVSCIVSTIPRRRLIGRCPTEHVSAISVRFGGTGIIESWSEQVEAKLSLSLLAAPARRSTVLALPAVGVVLLSFPAFLFNPHGVQGSPDSPAATATPTERRTPAALESEGHPVSVAMSTAWPAHIEPNTEQPDRHVGTGFAENVWDFNARVEVPGSWPLDTAEVRRLAKMLLGQ